MRQSFHRFLSNTIINERGENLLDFERHYLRGIANFFNGDISQVYSTNKIKLHLECFSQYPMETNILTALIVGELLVTHEDGKNTRLTMTFQGLWLGWSRKDKYKNRVSILDLPNG